MFNIFPLHALFAANGSRPNPDLDARQALAAADLILGVEVMSGRAFVLYGKKLLLKIAWQNRCQTVNVFRIERDEGDGSPDVLAVLIEVAKMR